MKENKPVKVLLVYPSHPETFWSFKHILKYISKKAAFPPLGLLTVAAMLPASWEKKVVDMNVSHLSDADILWADYVFISAMIVMKDSVRKVIERVKALGKKVVAGGPLFTADFESYPDVDHLVLGEAEITLPLFLRDLEAGEPSHLYRSDEHPQISGTPVPLWELIRMKDYATMSVQYSRGCPFNCEFCDITIMNGRIPRTKGPLQLLTELDALYRRGWRGSVFIVDDNFIGKKEEVKAMLPQVIDWMKKRNHPFTFITEASINLADDPVLMRLMVDAGFKSVFIGIETPSEEGLVECRKYQNEGRDMVASVKTIQRQGLEVFGGFIVGFDSDPPSIFERQISFIQKSGVVVAMVGILTALPGTLLYNRLKKEDRLLTASSGNNTECTVNFRPAMDVSTLLDGYRKIISTIYSPREYYERVITFLKEYHPEFKVKLQWSEVKALLRSFWYIGITGHARKYYWKLLAWALICRPRLFPVAVTLAIFGRHFNQLIKT
jgi:radical SAM superfamily enzyme YgiQ (UPF0313 family)